MRKDRLMSSSSLETESSCQTDNDNLESVLFRIVFDGKVDEVLLCEIERRYDNITDEESFNKSKEEIDKIQREMEREFDNKEERKPIQNMKFLKEQHPPSQHKENSSLEKKFCACNNGCYKINDIWSESNNIIEFWNNNNNNCSDNKTKKHRFLYKIRAASTEDLICSLRRRECVCALVLTSTTTEKHVNNSEHALHEKENYDNSSTNLKLSGNHTRDKCAHTNIKKKEIVIASAHITLLKLFNTRVMSFIFFIDRKALSTMSKQCHKQLWKNEDENSEEENQELNCERKTSYLQQHWEEEEEEEEQLLFLHQKNNNHTQLELLEQTHLYNSSNNIQQMRQCSSITNLYKLYLQPCSSVRLTLCMREVKEVKMQLCNLSLRKLTQHNKTMEDVNDNCKFELDMVAGRYELTYALVKEKNTTHKQKLWQMQTRKKITSWKNYRKVNNASEMISGKKVKLCSAEPMFVDVNTFGKICKSGCNVCNANDEDAVTMHNSFPALTFKMTTNMLQQCHLAITLKSASSCTMHSSINNVTKNSYDNNDNGDDNDDKETATKKSSNLINKELVFKLPIRTAEALALQSEEDERNDRCTLPFTVLESNCIKEYISHHELQKKEQMQKVISRDANKENEIVCTYELEGELVLFHLPQFHEVARRFSQITLEERELPESLEPKYYELESDIYHSEDANITATAAAAGVTATNDTNIDVEIARRYLEDCNGDYTINIIADNSHICGKDSHDGIDENSTDEQKNNFDSNNHIVSDATNHSQLHEQNKIFVEYSCDEGSSRKGSNVLQLKNEEVSGQSETLHHQSKQANKQESVELPIAKTEESTCFSADEQHEGHDCNLDDMISLKYESKVVSYGSEEENMQEMKKECIPRSQEKESWEEKWEEYRTEYKHTQEEEEKSNQEEEQEQYNREEEQEELRSSPLPRPLTITHPNSRDHVNYFNMREEYPNYIASLPFFNSIAMDSDNEQVESQLLQYRTRMMETPSVPITNASHSVSLESMRKCLIVFRRLCKEYSELCERNERRIYEMNKQYELHNKAIVLSYEHNADNCYNNLHDDNMFTTHKATNINANDDIVTELICRTEEQEKLLTERYQCKLQEKETLEEKIREIEGEETKVKLELEMYETTLRPEKLQQFTERRDKICEMIEIITQEKEKLIHLSANVQEKMEEITSNELYPHPPLFSSHSHHSNHSHHSHHVFHHRRSQPGLNTAPSSTTELESSTTLASKSSSMILTTKNLEVSSSLPTFPMTHHSTSKANTYVTKERKSQRTNDIGKYKLKSTAVSKASAWVNAEKRRKTLNNEVHSSQEDSLHQRSVVSRKNNSWNSSITPDHEHVFDDVKYTLPRFLKQNLKFCSEFISSRILEDEEEMERDLFAVYCLHKPKKPSIRPYFEYITENKTDLHLRERQVKPQEVNHPYYRRHKRFHLPFDTMSFHDKTES